jgi:hypothetical protein
MYTGIASEKPLNFFSLHSMVIFFIIDTICKVCGKGVKCNHNNQTYTINPVKEDIVDHVEFISGELCFKHGCHPFTKLTDDQNKYKDDKISWLTISEYDELHTCTDCTDCSHKIKSKFDKNEKAKCVKNTKREKKRVRKNIKNFHKIKQNNNSKHNQLKQQKRLIRQDIIEGQLFDGGEYDDFFDWDYNVKYDNPDWIEYDNSDWVNRDLNYNCMCGACEYDYNFFPSKKYYKECDLCREVCYCCHETAHPCFHCSRLVERAICFSCYNKEDIMGLCLYCITQAQKENKYKLEKIIDENYHDLNDKTYANKKHQITIEEMEIKLIESKEKNNTQQMTIEEMEIKLIKSVEKNKKQQSEIEEKDKMIIKLIDENNIADKKIHDINFILNY